MEIVVSIPFIPLVIAALISFVDDKRAIPRISMFFSGLIAIISLIGTAYEFMFHKVIVGFYNYNTIYIIKNVLYQKRAA